MEKQTVTFHAGALQVPEEVQRTLGLTEGAELSISVRDGGVFYVPQAEQLDKQGALEAIERLHGMFADGPSLEDDLRALRMEWEERLERLSA